MSKPLMTKAQFDALVHMVVTIAGFAVQEKRGWASRADHEEAREYARGKVHVARRLLTEGEDDA